MAKSLLGVTAVGVEIAARSLMSCGLPKLRPKKKGCDGEIWVVTWDMRSFHQTVTCGTKIMVCFCQLTQTANAFHFYDHLVSIIF